MDLKLRAINKFNTKDMRGYFSPGRVNLIGEHIDYNGGFVLPCSLDIGTTGFLSIREDRIISCYSENFPELGVISFSLDELVFKDMDHWTNYVKGMIKDMNLPKGFNLYVSGNIPTESGLSSSASLELLVGTAINDLFTLGYSKLDLVKIAKICENDFIGVSSGIMDQFVIGMTEDQSAMLLNTSTLEYQAVKVDLQDYIIIIANTNKKRTLATSKYNERRNECEKGLKYLQTKLNINELCELDVNRFNENMHLIKDNVILRRVRHAVTENVRTIKAYHALKENDLKLFGKLLNESHQSLKDDYEVTCLELDLMQFLFIQNGSIGARMTGAGFGGCVIALVKKTDAEKVTSIVGEEYQKITGLKPQFYQVRIGSGAKAL